MSIDVFPMSVLNATLWNGQSMPLSIAGGGTGATTAATARTNLGLGTMAQQDASAVAITGGSATGLTTLGVSGPSSLAGATGIGIAPDASYALKTSTFPAWFGGRISVGGPPPSDNALHVSFPRAAQIGLVLRATDADTGNAHVVFANAIGGIVGSITCTGSATAYGTSSDSRLKHAITPLLGALDVVQRLRPITHLWNADDSRGYGFLAHELQREIPDAVTGEPDAVHEDGSVKPQQVDHSRLVPWLTSALQDAVAQVQALSARVDFLEQQLGL